MRCKKILVFVCVFGIVCGLCAYSADKYANEIFLMGAGVRNFSLGRAGVTDNDTTAPAYWNASLLLNQDTNSIDMMHAEEFKGMLKYDTISGAYGGIGFTLARIGINNIKLTRLENEADTLSANNKPYVYKTVDNADYILYIGLARSISGVPIGVTPKLVYRSLVDTSAYGFGLDVSSHYEVNDRLMLGLRIRDIIPAQIYWDNGTHESTYIGFDAEARVRTTMPVIEKDLFVYVNGEINTEGLEEYSTVNVGDVSLDPHLGAELVLHPRVSLLAGYDIEHFTAGASVNYMNVFLNYSFEQNAQLDNSHRVSVGARF